MTDYLAVAVAISLPWSTSISVILMTLWLLAFLPTINFADIRREACTWAGGLPLLLLGWAILGAAWADTTWTDSVAALRHFQKLLFIPILLAYFRRSDCGTQVMACFIASCIVLLVASLIVAVRPELQPETRYPGVPVKTYITQSAEFAIAAFSLFYVSRDAFRAKQYGFAAIATLLALAFIGDIVFVVTSRTELVAIAMLVVLFGARFYGWKGSLASLAVLGLIGVLAWTTSDYLRERVERTGRDIQAYRTDSGADITSTAYRIEFLRKSVGFVTAAPVFGHGTGSIKSLFERSAAGQSGVSAAVTANPHNQILAVAMQLGFVGGAILCLMWIAHVLMFLRPGAAAWLGLVIVVQNIVGSLFNTHLFDFTEGWLYVCAVGVLGGTVLRQTDAPLPRDRTGFRWYEYFLSPQKRLV